MSSGGGVSGMDTAGNYISEGIILKTTNGGSEWSISFSQQGDEYKSLFFTSDQTGYAVSVNGKVLKTTDAGNSWSTLHQFNNAIFYKVYFTGNDTGYIAGYNYGASLILKTTDAGDNWQEVYSENSGTITDISFSNAKTGIAIGSFGEIIGTTDAGNTWTVVSNQQGMCSITKTIQDKFLVVGEQGLIYKIE